MSSTSNPISWRLRSEDRYANERNAFTARSPVSSMWRCSFLLIFSFAVAVFAQTPEALVQDAISKQRAGDLDGAVKEYREFLKVQPDAAVIRSNLGAALAGLGRFEEAVTEYKAALKQSPSLPGASLNLALAYYKMGRIGDAAKELAKVHAARPDK